MEYSLTSKAQKIKAIFFDIDGTLLSDQTHKIPESAIAAARAAKENGMLLFVATGRHKLQLTKIPRLDEIPFDGYVTLNGQYCCDAAGKVLYQHAIDPADVRRMTGYVEENEVPCLFWEADSMYVSRMDEIVIRTHSAPGSIIPEARDISRAYERGILQMGLYLPDQIIPAIVRELTSCDFTRWNLDGIDIVPRGGNKWVGVTETLRQFGLSPDEAMTFGDGDNDIELLANAGLSVAMGNAGTHVKSVADYVTGSVDEDGIYTAMGKFFSWMSSTTLFREESTI